MRTFGAAMATLSVGVLAAGLLWPHLAMIFLQGLLMALALGYVGARIYRADLPKPMASDAYSPFAAQAPKPLPSTSPPAVRHMTMLLRAADDPAAARRASIPAEAYRIVVAEASRRLAEHHGLDPLRPEHHERIRALVSDPTWELLPTEPARAGAGADLGSGSLALLDTVLDDVERL